MARCVRSVAFLRILTKGGRMSVGNRLMHSFFLFETCSFDVIRECSGVLKTIKNCLFLARICLFSPSSANILYISLKNEQQRSESFPKKTLHVKISSSQNSKSCFSKKDIRTSFKSAHTACPSSNWHIPWIWNCEILGSDYESCLHLFDRNYAICCFNAESPVLMVDRWDRKLFKLFWRVVD